MKDSRDPVVWNGILAATLVTMALIGTLFFGWSVAGLPFVPFDVFDWLTRVLPGRLIAFSSYRRYIPSTPHRAQPSLDRRFAIRSESSYASSKLPSTPW